MRYLFIGLLLAIAILSCKTEITNTAPTISDQDFSLVENPAKNYLIGRIAATDPEGDKLSFAIVDGNTDNAFSINTNNGGLIVNSPEVFDFETSPVFSLTIEVSDGNFSEHASVKITLIDEFESTYPELGPCELKRVSSNWVGLGIPRLEGFTPSLGTVNMPVVFVDFDNVPATKTPEDVFSILQPAAPDFLDKVSYGRIDLQLQPHFEWYRLSQSSSHYGFGLRDGAAHKAFIQEAVDSADAEVDFSNADAVLVVSNPDAMDIPIGPAFGAFNDFWAIKADGNHMYNGVTSGYDLNHWGGIWLVHELGHTFTLPDLYDFAGGHGFVGGFSIMGNIGGEAPGFFAFERWMMGWLDDAQVFCHDQGEVVIHIDQLEGPGGTKAAIVPLDARTALVMECRRKEGVDLLMGEEGLLVYLVDTSIETGNGPIKVLPNPQPDAPLAQGEEFNYKGISIKVLQAEDKADKVRIIVP
ncbi:MAG: cadherin domain-containing protein [Bacteroidota bacterium]